METMEKLVCAFGQAGINPSGFNLPLNDPRIPGPNTPLDPVTISGSQKHASVPPSSPHEGCEGLGA